MSTATLAPTPAVADLGDLPAHYTCCDENTAMCGAQLLGIDLADDDPTPDCQLCVYAWENGVPCPATNCPAGGAP